MDVEDYADLACTILTRPPRLGTVRFVAVDGPAGSGKTTFAARCAHALRAAGASVAEIHVDDLLDGWTDMQGYWPRFKEWILEPFRQGRPARYRRYDWVRGCFEDEWQTTAVPDVLVLEGVTSGRAAATPHLSLCVLVIAERQLRLARGIARDGEALYREWVRWMAEEDRHFAADATDARADIVVDGAPTVAHDPQRQFVRLPRDRFAQLL